MTETIEGVTLGEIKRRRNLKSCWRNFHFDTKEEFDAANISDERIARYILLSRRKPDEKRLDKIQAALSRQAEDIGWEERYKEKLEELNKEEEELFQRLLDDFDAPTSLDEANLSAIAKMQHRLGKIQDNRKYFMVLPTEEQTDKSTLETFAALSEEEGRILREIRQWQKDMGLDKPTRDKRVDEVTGEDEVKRIIADSKVFMEQHINRVNHCGIEVMWILDHFPENFFVGSKQCPRCLELIDIEWGKGEVKDADIEAG